MSNIKIINASIHRTILSSSSIYTDLDYKSNFPSVVAKLPSYSDSIIPSLYDSLGYEVYLKFNQLISNFDKSYIELYKCQTTINLSPQNNSLNPTDREGIRVVRKNNQEYLIILPYSSLISDGAYTLKINHPLMENNPTYIFFLRYQNNTLPAIDRCFREFYSLSISPTPTKTPTPTITPTNTITPTKTTTPTQTTTITKTITRTPTQTPSITPTLSLTASKTPTPTPSATRCNYTISDINSFNSPYVPTPTPTLSSNIPRTKCSIHLNLRNLTPNNRYHVEASFEDTYGSYFITPSQLDFTANSSKHETMAFIVSKPQIATSAKIVIQVHDIDGLESYTTRSQLTSNTLCECDCLLNGMPYTNSSTESSSEPVLNISQLSANYGYHAYWGGFEGNVTTVGTNGFPSYYGTYDQCGNVWEWIDDLSNKSDHRFLFGGSWASNFFEMDSTSQRSKLYQLDSIQSPECGFRVCSYNNPYSYDCFTNVGNECNIDYRGVGTVRYQYMIGIYPVTNKNYVEFLNSVAIDPKISETINLYNFDHPRSAINRTFDTFNNIYVYTIKNNMDYKPVTLINHISAKRYCNWLHNEKFSTSQSFLSVSQVFNLLDSGAYILNSSNKERQSTATYFLPNINEWYKAAYYNPAYQHYTKYSMYKSTISFTESGFVPRFSNAGETGNGCKSHDPSGCESS